MHNSVRKISLLIFIVLIASFILVQANPPQEIEQRLQGLTEKEQETLTALFTMTQEIQAMEREELALASQLKEMEQESVRLEEEIAAEEERYNQKRSALEQVLKSYQRMGPGTYLEILMDSDSLAELLRRINTLRDITGRTGRLLEDIEASKAKLADERLTLKNKRSLMEEKLSIAQKTMIEKLKLKEAREAYLTSLKEQQIFYQGYLAEIQQMWEQTKPMFGEIAKEFSTLISAGNLPPEAIKISFSLYMIKGTIDEVTFNELLSKQEKLPRMVFDFQPDRVQIELPEQGLSLRGSFTIPEENVLRFEAAEGSFFEMPLEPEAIEELFEAGALELNLKTILGKNTLQTIEIQDETLQMSIKPDFFSRLFRRRSV